MICSFCPSLEHNLSDLYLCDSPMSLSSPFISIYTVQVLHITLASPAASPRSLSLALKV